MIRRAAGGALFHRAFFFAVHGTLFGGLCCLARGERGDERDAEQEVFHHVLIFHNADTTSTLPAENVATRNVTAAPVLRFHVRKKIRKRIAIVVQTPRTDFAIMQRFFNGVQADIDAI